MHQDRDNLNDEEDESITERGWEAISTLLCNKTSIMNTYNSNHTLQCVFGDGNPPADVPGDLDLYLEMNRNKDKAEVARQKIFKIHFSTESEGASKIQMLLDTELEMIPSAIAWIGRPIHANWNGTNVSGLSLMYNLTRRLPDLFDSSAHKKPSAATKRTDT